MGYKTSILMFSVFLLFILAACGSTQTVIAPTAKPVPDAQPEAVQPSAAPPAPQPSSAAGVSPDEQPRPATVAQAAPSAAVREIAVTAKKFSFSPDSITVKQGDRVRLQVTVPADDTTHGLAIKEFDVNANLEPGKTTTVEFTASKAGTYTIFCSVFCGEGHKGMKGTLVVEP